MGKKILITGGTGTVGKDLSKALIQNGHEVVLLSRNPSHHSPYNTFKWDVKKQEIDPNCIQGVDTIVHLAGAGIADERWTDKRKKELIDSRTESIALIYKLLQQENHQVKSIVSASAAGYYSDRDDQLMFEESTPANDFLGDCCIKWEQAVDEGNKLGLRIVKFRTGVILDKYSGALQKIAQPIKYGFGAPLGNGKQWISWIHLKDVTDMYLFGIEHEFITGAFNMCSPHPLTNAELTKAIAKQLKKPLWLPNVPAFALKLALGEMSAVVLGSTKMSTQKIEEIGFGFAYPTIDKALQEIYG
ncbi:TIGR01777 family oxidoreductase [Pedobacter arcticus]|uniref:TIGR01777 family oxidoreductase n=1 Tax=Pedobacter arcticus TaxID=752140 RepID=UPI0003053E91|nr:TIGR01777 family oxidoreductase [Pedobacter arcticus]